MKRVLLSVLLLAGLLSHAARADVVVLVHGYLGGAGSWDYSGVTTTLQQHGWQRAGVYAAGPSGVQFIPARGAQTAQKYYAVDLPSEAPILVQVYQLHEILATIARTHSGEPVVLVGHSAGGVVARAALVRGDVHNVKALITIASPHLGTDRAEQALDVTDIPFPLSVVTDLLGGDTYDTAMRSRSLYIDLIRPQPGSLLYWLNAQPHPNIEYFSIVRGQTASGRGDYIVPAYSQDMNNVPALRGRSSLITVPVRHGLEPVDGGILVNLLADLH
ncbi:MAG: alpha/beta fold hydrolase [Gammaproteobacteria bacterium]|nr:alpha/beta fold hydrolase [Gammaproteobacteria bacterium]